MGRRPRPNDPAAGKEGRTITLGDKLKLRTPVWTVAPMVSQCDAPFRLLARRYGARLVYSEMLMADQFAEDRSYRAAGLGLGADDLVPADDHPLVVQFAANDPAVLLKAALAAQRCGADAVDINFGCPQNRAKGGHYGSFLTDPEDWALCGALVRACAESPELHIPCCAKIRLQPTIEATVEFARLLEAAGCAMVAVHGRTRGDEHHRREGPADLQAIAAVKAALGTPVLTNGNVSSAEDALYSLQVTGADGVMSAEQLLRDPALFARCERALGELDGGVAAAAAVELPEAVRCAEEYLEMCSLHAPSSVWYRGYLEDGPCDVARQHLLRLLQFLQGSRDFLQTPMCMHAKSVAELLTSFRKWTAARAEFAARCEAAASELSGDEDEEDEADEMLLRLARISGSRRR